ncbi:MAG TPA: 1-acyl-sn-glycerol-3-phosphate acyltransferase, partial [Mycobacterium sp.]|nr:1-acyl-sn-glycerol-3-phosphate acyltransferase [Mycobacterium sp.]
MAGPFEELTRALARTPAGLKGRDPEFIRQMLPRFWLAARIYFRAEVNGFENVPGEPVLFVGNHSGGANIPDTFVFTLAYHTYFTVEGRPLVGLAHEVVVRMPIIGDMARKFGMVRAGPAAAAKLLQQGANVMVYPGGDVEALRPWRDRNKIVFDGRMGFLKLAHANRVKIVPVVATGG